MVAVVTLRWAHGLLACMSRATRVALTFKCGDDYDHAQMLLAWQRTVFALRTVLTATEYGQVEIDKLFYVPEKEAAPLAQTDATKSIENCVRDILLTGAEYSAALLSAHDATSRGGATATALQRAVQTHGQAWYAVQRYILGRAESVSG
jgi:hypothetical protein